MKSWSALRADPLLLFLVLGGALAFAWRTLAPRDLTTLQVERAAIRARVAFEEELIGRSLTPAEREEVSRDAVDEEVLIQEALRRGLHLSDGRMRKRLVQMMRSALTEPPTPPSPAQLQSFFRENIDEYTKPESTTLDQIPFPWGEDTDDATLERALEALQGGADPEDLGGFSMAVARHVRAATRQILVGQLGGAAVDQIESFPVGEWRGPVESPHGRHLIRVVERHPPEVPRFEDVEAYIGDQWTFQRTRERQQELIDELRTGYRIEIVGDTER